VTIEKQSSDGGMRCVISADQSVPTDRDIDVDEDLVTRLAQLVDQQIREPRVFVRATAIRNEEASRATFRVNHGCQLLVLRGVRDGAA